MSKKTGRSRLEDSVTERPNDEERFEDDQSRKIGRTNRDLTLNGACGFLAAQI
jgi:hypothetical protein